jgi:hypothetical protein
MHNGGSDATAQSRANQVSEVTHAAPGDAIRLSVPGC